jgi:ParB-like chromosome segregation protein Spo0J
MESVPVIVLKITEDQRKAFAVADNKTAELADWDYLKLQKILVELKHKKFNLPSLGYSQAELQALLTKQKEFDWKAFEERFKDRLMSTYALVLVKVPAQRKDDFNRAIKSLASKYGLKQSDFAKTAGEVLGILLGLSQ